MAESSSDTTTTDFNKQLQHKLDGPRQKHLLYLTSSPQQVSLKPVTTSAVLSQQEPESPPKTDSKSFRLFLSLLRYMYEEAEHVSPEDFSLVWTASLAIYAIFAQCGRVQASSLFMPPLTKDSPRTMSNFGKLVRLFHEHLLPQLSLEINCRIAEVYPAEFFVHLLQRLMASSSVVGSHSASSDTGEDGAGKGATLTHGPGLAPHTKNKTMVTQETAGGDSTALCRQRWLHLEREYDTLCQSLASKFPDRYSFPLTAEQVYKDLYEDDTNCFVALGELRTQCDQAAIDLYLSEHGQQESLYGVCFDGAPIFFESFEEAQAYPLIHAKRYPIAAMLMYPASWKDTRPVVVLG